MGRPKPPQPPLLLRACGHMWQTIHYLVHMSCIIAQAAISLQLSSSQKQGALKNQRLWYCIVYCMDNLQPISRMSRYIINNAASRVQIKVA